MEPFLFISFATEIEGEKVSTVNSYPKDMNQQDMFNAAMAYIQSLVYLVSCSSIYLYTIGYTKA
jgi:hypothetical protein